jgi:hypothetical protein
MWLAGPSAPEHIASWRLGLRPENCASGDWPDDARSGSGRSARRRPISWATGLFACLWRISASAARSAFSTVFELTQRAGRIAPRADMLRRNPLAQMRS